MQFLKANVQVGATANVDVTLSHQQESREVVDVVESSPAIDPAQVSTKEELTGAQIVDIPYPGTHDYRNALIFIPGVTPDAFGQPHVAGAESYQTLVLLDGFNVAQPTNGQLVVRTSVESFRSIEVTPSREPAEFGKGSGGVLALNTRMGDDHFRVHLHRLHARDCRPSRGSRSASGRPFTPCPDRFARGKCGSLTRLTASTTTTSFSNCHPVPISDHVWRVDNLAKLQSNLTTRNIVTVSFLSNYYHDQYAGLSVLQPQSTTQTDAETSYIGSLKDQYYFRGGALLETGFGADQYSVALTPQGSGPYILTTQAAAGNYYLRQNTSARRLQGLANLYFPPHQWHGRHDIKVGTDLDRLSYDSQVPAAVNFVSAAG
jgi:hypothetical protein